jgi:diguanylate cyclase (GGDEF)-like protein
MKIRRIFFVALITVITLLSLSGIAVLGYTEYAFAHGCYPLYVLFLIALIPVGLLAPKAISIPVAVLSGVSLSLGQSFNSPINDVLLYRVFINGGALSFIGVLFTLGLSGSRKGFLLRRRLKRCDLLTGLMNHHYFMAELNGFLRNSIESKQPITIAFFYCDNLNHINGANGFEAGDNALRLIGSVIRNSIHSKDIAARMPGSDIVLCCPGLDFEKANGLLKNIRDALVKRMAETNFPISFNVGAHTYGVPPRFGSVVVKRVMDTMYFARAEGKNIIYHETISAAE